ncbi:MAG: TIM-barrel domain-containing protein [Chloroflexota bacterium]
MSSPFITLIIPALLLLGLMWPHVATSLQRTSLVPQAGQVSSAEPRPPLTPRWAYEPWVWEDEVNTAQAVRELVDGYIQRDIPTGVVIIDSPWQTNYNTFQFNDDYPDPAGLVDELHAKKIRVILWVTPFINVTSDDGPGRGKAALYDEAQAAGYFVDPGRVTRWDKGEGSAIDFFNPEAVTWWYAQMDRAFAAGVDGWKVDSPEGNLPGQFQTAAGLKTDREYGDEYYRAMYRYVVERRPDAITFARAVDSGTVYAPVSVNPAAWVGDQNPSWAGLRESFDDVLASSKHGFSMVGPDIGGYRRGERSQRVFLRWAQFGALVPLMENGGRGEHRPWMYGEEATAIYRLYAKLHHELVPYLYSAGIEAHRTGLPIIRNPDTVRKQYELGRDILVAPLINEDEKRDVYLPGGARWHNFWADDDVYDGDRTLSVPAPIGRTPLYIRSGAIIPLQVDDPEPGHGDRSSTGRLTLLVYPGIESSRVFHPNPDETVTLRSSRAGAAVEVQISPRSERYVLRIKEPGQPAEVQLTRNGQNTRLSSFTAWDDFERASDASYYDEESHYLWVRFDTDQADARLNYSATSVRRD